MPLGAGLRAGEQLQFSDLLVGTVADRFTPRIEASIGVPLGALIELYAADAAHSAMPVSPSSCVDPVVTSWSPARQVGSAPRLCQDGGSPTGHSPSTTSNLTTTQYRLSSALSGAHVGRVNRLIRLKR